MGEEELRDEVVGLLELVEVLDVLVVGAFVGVKYMPV